MKYNLYKAMQKPKILIYVHKEYLFALALMKLKCLMQKILSLYLQEKENRWKDTNLLRESIFSFIHPEMHGIQRIGVPGLDWNMILHISRVHKH